MSRQCDGAVTRLKKELFLRHAWFLALFVLAGVALPFGIREGNDWGGDFAVYILEARNFAEHRPFYETSYVPTPESLVHHPAVYPPLASLLLAPVYAVRGLDYRSMKLVLALFLWLSFPLYYVIGCRRGVKPGAMAVILLLFVLSPLVLSLEQTVGSDFIFVFISALSLLTIDEIYRREWDIRRPLFAGVLAATLLFLCYLTRAAGLAMIGGFAAYELRRSRRVRVFSLIAGGITATAFLLYTNFLFDARGQYGSQFVRNPAIWAHNAIAYLQTPAVVWAAAPAVIRYPLAAVTLCLAIAGFARRLRRPTLVEFYFALSVAVLVVYFVSDRRYMLPVIPFMLMYAAEALDTLMSRIESTRPDWKSAWRIGLATCLLVALATSFANLRVAETGPVRDGVSQPSFAELCDFLRLNIPPDGLILSWNPRVLALYTGKHSALYPQDSSPEIFQRALPASGSRFLVFHQQDLDRQSLSPYLNYAGPRLGKRFENSDFQVFAIPDSPNRP